jgi:hypothetical protein
VVFWIKTQIVICWAHANPPEENYASIMKVDEETNGLLILI